MDEGRGRATEVALPSPDGGSTLIRMMRRSRARAMVRWAGALAVVLLIAWSSVLSASAAGSTSGVVRHGTCVGGPSHWRLRVLTIDPGTLIVRFRLSGGGPGETWNLFLDQNGTGFFAGSRVSDETGRVRLIRSTTDQPGDDVIRAAGHDVATGEVCRGRARI